MKKTEQKRLSNGQIINTRKTQRNDVVRWVFERF